MSIPVISIAQMREWEAATWATGIKESEVICQAGQAVAEFARQLTEVDQRVLILAGKGHNGDDARLAGENQLLADRQIVLLVVDDPEQGRLDFQEAISTEPALIIDGLFGIGLNRPLSAPWQQFIEEINATGLPVLAVDVPSGLNADTGETMGKAIQASVTVTLGAPKQGLLKTAATTYVGRLESAPNIGLLPCPIQTDLQYTDPADFAGFPPRRTVASHKGTFGHLLIYAGSVGYHGAAVLAALGATRARPGLISLCTPENAYLPIAAQLKNVMVHPWHPDFQSPGTTTAILCGPGLAAGDLPRDLRTKLMALWQETPLPMIADASALDWLPQGPTPAGALRVITPHPGEAARCLKTTVAQVQQDRLHAVRELSHAYGDCWVVLKGYQTMVGRQTGECHVNCSGNPGLAQGGSGDVLAGYLGGLLAQPGLQADPLTTLRFGVWQHGATADDLERRSLWTVEDLAAQIGAGKIKS